MLKYKTTLASVVFLYYICTNNNKQINNIMKTIENVIAELEAIKVNGKSEWGWSVLISSNDIMVVITKVKDDADQIFINDLMRKVSYSIFDFNISHIISSVNSVSPILTKNYNLIAVL